MSMFSETNFLDTTQALRLHLLEEFAPLCGLEKALELAPAAEAFVLGTPAPQAETMAWTMAGHLSLALTLRHTPAPAEAPTIHHHAGHSSTGENTGTESAAPAGGSESIGGGFAQDVGSKPTGQQPPGEPKHRVPVFNRGEVTVTDLLANRREELLRWWLAGKKVIGPMTDHFGASYQTIRRALHLSGIAEAFPRGAAGKAKYELVPLDAPLPPEAQRLIAGDPLVRESGLDIEVTVTRKKDAPATADAGVELPPTPVVVRGRSEPIMLARDVPQGQSWAFRDHRTLAEVGVPDAPSAPPVLAGAPTTVQEVLGWLRSIGLSAMDKGDHFLVEGQRIATKGSLVAYANVQRSLHRKPAIRLS